MYSGSLYQHLSLPATWSDLPVKLLWLCPNIGKGQLLSLRQRIALESGRVNMLSTKATGFFSMGGLWNICDQWHQDKIPWVMTCPAINQQARDGLFSIKCSISARRSLWYHGPRISLPKPIYAFFQRLFGIDCSSETRTQNLPDCLSDVLLWYRSDGVRCLITKRENCSFEWVNITCGQPDCTASAEVYAASTWQGAVGSFPPSKSCLHGPSH